MHGIIDAELRLHLMKDWHEEEQRLEQSKCKNMIAQGEMFYEISVKRFTIISFFRLIRLR